MMDGLWRLFRMPVERDPAESSTPFNDTVEYPTLDMTEAGASQDVVDTVNLLAADDSAVKDSSGKITENKITTTSGPRFQDLEAINREQHFADELRAMDAKAPEVVDDTKEWDAHARSVAGMHKVLKEYDTRERGLKMEVGDFKLKLAAQLNMIDQLHDEAATKDAEIARLRDKVRDEANLNDSYHSKHGAEIKHRDRQISASKARIEQLERTNKELNKRCEGLEADAALVRQIRDGNEQTTQPAKKKAKKTLRKRPFDEVDLFDDAGHGSDMFAEPHDEYNLPSAGGYSWTTAPICGGMLAPSAEDLTPRKTNEHSLGHGDTTMPQDFYTDGSDDWD